MDDITDESRSNLRSYKRTLKQCIGKMVENYLELIKMARVEPNPVNNAMSSSHEQEQYQMKVRSANICKAGEDLVDLIQNIRQFLIIHDFPLINEAFSAEPNFRKIEAIDNKLLALRDDMAAELYELEEEYYHSAYKK